MILSTEGRKAGKACLTVALISIALLFLEIQASGQVDQVARWNSATLRPQDTIRLDKAVALYRRTASRYEAVQRMRRDGVPAPVIFCLHYRESTNDFSRHLHEGSPLTHRTRFVPKNRLPNAEPPFTWEQSAEDAIYVCDRLQGDWRSLARALDRIEGYNGLGYRARGLPSPYLWAGTVLYERGKFVGDGRFGATAVDAQLGCAAILKRMVQRGLVLPFTTATARER